jgi:hypothetical protein
MPSLLVEYSVHVERIFSSTKRKEEDGERVRRSSFQCRQVSLTVTLKKILEREDQYLFVAPRTFTNLFLGVAYLNPLRAVPDLTQLSLESIYL